ncbi:hypothetical protein BJ944DRAFT_277761 [Cunninghamella echinulata]|nr:hypothetical protein BJ944DRAFT_277761 [Cunninghamella echinulata]
MSTGSDHSSDISMDSPEKSHSKRKSVIDTRRAEQNRAAQRAFRQRKELYVKELENKVRDMDILKDRVERLEKENERLKYRVWELESSQNTTTSTSSKSTYSPYHEEMNYKNEHPSSTTTMNNIKTSSSTSLSSSLSPTSPPPTSIISNTTTTTTTSPNSTSNHHILPPPSPSPSVFRPIPVAYWDKESIQNSNKRHRPMDDHTSSSTLPPQQQQHLYHDNNNNSNNKKKNENNDNPSDQGRVLDDLVTILHILIKGYILFFIPFIFYYFCAFYSITLLLFYSYTHPLHTLPRTLPFLLHLSLLVSLFKTLKKKKKNFIITSPYFLRFFFLSFYNYKDVVFPFFP